MAAACGAKNGVYLLLFTTIVSRLGSALTLRGVAITKLPFYDSSKDFTCLDGSLTIPFSSVNDDYCDCNDGSDEPGTAACPNGQFHCTNAGYRPKNYPSSRVNDGICDCCDGSDEYDGKVNCPDTCKELYKQEFEKRRHEIELAKQGYAKKQEFSQDGINKKTERKKKLEDLRLQLEQKKQVVAELQATKDKVEAVEKEAKDKHDKEWEETKAKILAERAHNAAVAAFKLLDTDNSGSLTSMELMVNPYMDKEYTAEEARELLGGTDETDVDRFAKDLWTTFKDKYGVKQEEKPIDASPPEDKPPTDEHPTETPVDPHPTPPSIDDTIDDDADLPEVGDDDDDEGDDLKDEAAARASDSKQEEEPVKPEYDEETKAKITDADNARKEFDAADIAKRDIEREIGDIEKKLNIDFGEHEEFAALYGNCFEFRDREYLYKLCPFDRATQEPKDGGASTSIGNWGEWNGSPYKYSRMKYSDGQNCWNGPNRSTQVILSCGPDNEVTSVSEPSRCEYQMEFKTPAACQHHEDILHQEL
ncbi:predicted protein [Nematostella vectensis]|uniref:Glucosidase 2 subunit beta n=1 Tax=Nematostella vectensis TaxID=45351 RepID=A7SJQ2_NEMVE|nr:predicted protein [Nematostella vectensis]|eukprot:XP_001628146.1 predicted protein [Nematostella vectensis]